MQPTTSPIVQAANNVKSELHVVFDDGTWPSDRSLGGAFVLFAVRRACRIQVHCRNLLLKQGFKPLVLSRS